MPRMMRRYFDPDDPDDPDEDEGRIVADGGIVRTPAILLDAVHRDVEAAIQARQRSDLTLHRPGSLPQSRTAASAAAAQAWEARGAYLADAWRAPAPLPPDSTSRQHLDDHRPAAADAQAAWAERGRFLADAWRLP